MNTVVLLPGLDGTGLLFHPLLEKLPDHVNKLVISYPTDQCFDYEQLAQWVFSQLPKDDFILVAESFSGYVAYLIGLKKPNHLQSIIFVASFLTNPNPLLLGLSKVIPMSILLKFTIPNFIVKRFLLGGNISQDTIKLFKDAISKVNTKVLTHRLKLLSKLSYPAQTCDVQAIYIQASNDRLVSTQSLEVFKKVFINLTVYEIYGPHFVLQSNPEECVKIIRSILSF